MAVAPALLRKHAASAAAALLLLFFFMVHRQDSVNCTLDCRIGRAVWGQEASRIPLCEPESCPVIVPRLGHCDGGCKGAGGGASSSSCCSPSRCCAASSRKCIFSIDNSSASIAAKSTEPTGF